MQTCRFFDTSTHVTSSPSSSVMCQQDCMRVGPKLRQLVADIDACSSSPEALQKLKQLQFLPRRAVEAEVSETVQCIERVLQQATSGSVRNMPCCLFTISKVAQAHPPLLRALQSDAYKATMSGMFKACAADGGLYRRAVAVSQLCSAHLRDFLVHVRLWCALFTGRWLSTFPSRGTSPCHSSVAAEARSVPR